MIKIRNKSTVSMNKHLMDYRVIIFDVDGTLYSQPALRLYMAADLLRYYICHPFLIKELFIIRKYRFVRENWQKLCPEPTELSSSIEERQYAYVAEKMNTSSDNVRKLISYWLHKHPLKLIPRYKDARLSALISSLGNKGITTAIYSDYPAAEKLEALGIPADYIFCSSDEGINCMKPDPKAMYIILDRLHEIPENVLMIGDRYSRDGLAAENTGIDFIILPKLISRRAALYGRLLSADIIP